MIQGIMEGIFDVCYLATALTLGIWMLIKGKSKYTKMFGLMAVLLAAGDSFHLIPRIYSLCGAGLEAHAFDLGLGKLITSVTMTIFYIILYLLVEMRMGKKNTPMRITIAALALARIILCCFPQNDWFVSNPSLLWGILRNIPFAAIGIIVIVLCFLHYKKAKDKDLLFMGIAVILSFAFYLPVVLLSGIIPIIGVLMIPKTLAYVWIVLIGFKHFRQEQKGEKVFEDIWKKEIK